MKAGTGCILLCALILCGFCGCAAPDSGGMPESKRSLLAMDTYMELGAYGERASEALEAAVSEIITLDRLLSATDSDSEIFRLNSENKLKVSKTTGDILSQAAELCRRTDGTLDITIYPLVLEWGFTTGEHNVPDDEMISKLLGPVDYTKIEINGETVTLPEGVMIDLGAVAKGYTGDVLASLMERYGVESALFDLGGNVHTVGAKPDGAPWRVAVKDPQNNGGYLGILDIEDKAVVTSGGYERYFEREGERYWHILDPRTGRPAESGLISVTVISDSGMLSDALSTALFVMGADSAVEHYHKYLDFEAVMVTDTGEVIITPGIADSFELLDSESYSLRILE